MLTLRGLRWPDDRDALLALDTSFTTERVYRVIATDTSFVLIESTVTPALRKVYALTEDVEYLPSLDHVVIAEWDARGVGLAALSHDVLDHRAIIRHLYVDRAFIPTRSSPAACW